MGFKAKVTREKYLDAARRGKSLTDKDIAERIGVDRTAVWRFRSKNPKIYEEAKQMLDDLQNLRFNSKTKPSYEVFSEIPIIKQWIDLMWKNSNQFKRQKVNALNMICHTLQTHPEKLSVEQCCDLVMQIRKKQDKGEKIPRGLAYYTIRSGIRSFFALIHGVSGDFLTAKGVGAEKTKGAGSMATETITHEQRRAFEKTIREAVVQCMPKVKPWNYLEINWATNETLEMARFMFATGARQNASLEAFWSDPKHKFEKDYWEIHVIDKGSEGGKDWQKRLLGEHLEFMKQYASQRFNIRYDELEEKLPKVDSKIFPILSENKHRQAKIMRKAQELANIHVGMQNHAWRHTFAQTALPATDWNYELVAEIGGWVSTETMKGSYGKMNEDAVLRGLRRAMGEDVKKETYELKW